jgi:hypothetical protein
MVFEFMVTPFDEWWRDASDFFARTGPGRGASALAQLPECRCAAIYPGAERRDVRGFTCFGGFT